MGRSEKQDGEMRDGARAARATMRINRALARAGLGSRRAVEEIITSGRVAVNGETVTDLATRIDPAKDKITLDGKPVRQSKLAYYAFYKPRGVITTMKDEKGRESVADCLRKLDVKEAVKPVGRLDRRSEGLLILTNDGSLAMKLMHPSAGAKKTYRVSLDRRITTEDAESFQAGIELSDGLAKFDALVFVRDNPKSCLYDITVTEGRNRLIRRMLGAREYIAKRLVRTDFGGVRLTGLKSGEIRKLSKHEVGILMKAGNM